MKKIIKLFTILLATLTPITAFTEDNNLILKNSEGKDINITDIKNGIVVFEWFNPECPFVKKIYKNNFMPSLQEDYIKKGVRWFVVSSTNKDHQDFVTEEKRSELKAKVGINNAEMIYDEKGDLGKTYGAKTTPHIMIFKNETLVYNGAFDDSPETESNPADAEKNYVKLALDALLNGKAIENEKTRPYGCSVKY
jgi:thioredoxin-related protein